MSHPKLWSLLNNFRFYFVSSADLLDMLSNGEIMIIAFFFLLNFIGNQPTLVAKHLTKLFDSMAKIKMQDATRFHRPFFYIAAISFVQHESCCNDRQGRWRSRILQGLPLRRPSMGILGLRVLTIAFWRLKSGWRPWCSQCGRQWGTLWCRFEHQLSSKLNLPTTLFRHWARMSRRRGRNGCSTTRPRFYTCTVTWETLMFRCPWQERKSGGLRRCSFQPHFCFLIFTLFHQHFHFPHQTTLATSLSQVCSAFSQLEEGLENSLKDYYKKQIAQLNNLISLLLGNLSKGDRQKVGIIDRPRERKCTLIILEQ